MIDGLLARLGAGRLGRAVLRIAALVAAILLLLLACRRSGERLGRLAVRLEASERTYDVQREMLRAAARRPRDRDDSLGGCGTAGSDRPPPEACPPVVGYDAELQERAAAEIDALAEGSAVAELLSDYAVMRDQARACAR